jgi:hypothetical protein
MQLFHVKTNYSVCGSRQPEEGWIRLDPVLDQTGPDKDPQHSIKAPIRQLFLSKIYFKKMFFSTVDFPVAAQLSKC